MAKVIGIDLGLKEYLTTSNNEVIQNPRWLRGSEEKLKKLQRNHSRKKKGSKNREKSRLKLAKQYENGTIIERISQYIQFCMTNNEKNTNEDYLIFKDTLSINKFYIVAIVFIFLTAVVFCIKRLKK